MKNENAVTESVEVTKNSLFQKMEKLDQYVEHVKSGWKGPRGKAFVAIAIVVGIIALIVLVNRISYYSKTKIDFSQYVTYDVSGLNDHAVIEAKFSSYTVCDKLFGNNWSNLIQGGFSGVPEVLENIKLDISKNKGLKNGDAVKIKAIYNKKELLDLGYRLVNTTKIVKISGLKKGKTVDVFKDLNVSFSGVSPQISVNFNNNNPDEFIRTVKYSLSDSSDNNEGIIMSDTPEYLKAGDKFKIYAKYDAESATEHGIIVEKAIKEYKVENVFEYVKNVNQLNQAHLKSINKETDDILASMLVSQRDDLLQDYYSVYDAYGYRDTKFSDMNRYKTYLLSSKGSSAENLYISFFKGKTVRDKETKPVYVAVVFSGVSIRGNEINISDKEPNIETVCRQDFNELYDELINARRNDYIYEEVK